MNMNINTFPQVKFLMPRVELHICKLTANIDHNLNFCLKVKLVQRHEDGETRSLLMLQILHGFQSC